MRSSQLTITILLISGILIPTLADGVRTAEQVRRINERCYPHKFVLIPKARPLFKKLTFHYDHLHIDGQTVPDSVAAGLLAFAPGEKVIGCRRFRSGGALFSTHALYCIGRNTYRRARGMSAMEYDTESNDPRLKKFYDFRQNFYYCLPYSTMGRVEKEDEPYLISEEPPAEYNEYETPEGQTVLLRSFEIEWFIEEVGRIYRREDTNAVNRAQNGPSGSE